MLSYDPITDALQKSASSKADWSTKITNSLGNDRRVRCFYDPNPNAIDPAVTGEEFLNIGNTGAIVGFAGNINSFGSLRGATIRKAVDLNGGGKAVMRIESSNGRWIQGTLGRKELNTDGDKANDVDFTMNMNPTTKTGYAINAGVRSPKMLPSGTGPTAPTPDEKRPVYMELQDWRNPAAPVVVKTSLFNVRDENITFDDPELSQDIGDVRVTMLNETIVYEGFEFGGLLLSSNPALNSVNGDTLHQVLVSCKPHGTWPSYPAMDTFNDMTATYNTKLSKGSTTFDVFPVGAVPQTITVTAKDDTNFSVVSDVNGAYPDMQAIFAGEDAPDYTAGLPVFDPALPANTKWAPFWIRIIKPSLPAKFEPGESFSVKIGMTYNPSKPQDVMHPQPFKILLKDINGVVLHTFQMEDGLPINSPQLPQARLERARLRPLWNCGMMLCWESHRPKENTYRYKNVPKADLSYMRPTMAKQGYTFNGAVPLLFGRTQVNSCNHYYVAPKWGVGYEKVPENDALDINLGDPYVYDVTNYYASGGVGNRLGRAIGWGYEPGSISLHDWYTGPGGSRSDRQVFATPLMLYHNEPHGIRLRDNSTYKENLDHWNRAYFNHSCHYVTSALTFDTIPSAEVNKGEWSYSRAYYGGTDNYVKGGLARHIAQWAIPNGSGGFRRRDRNGNLPYGGWAVDNLHCYACPAWVVMLWNSPMYLIAAKHRYIASMLCQLLGVNPANSPGFMERNGAWRWLHWLSMWKISTSHRLGIPRKEIEDRWQIDMEVIHDSFYIPTTDPTHPDYNKLSMRGLRGLGQRIDEGPEKSDDGLLHHVTLQHNGLAFYMTHVFLVMKTSGAWDVMYNKSEKCRKTLEFMLLCYDKQAVDMILDTNGRAEGGYPRAGAQVPVNETPDVATSWADWAVKIADDGSDWMHRADGTIRGEKDVGQHNRVAWCHVRKHYFPEFPYPRLDEAIAKYDAFYAERTAYVAAAESIGDARNRDWTYKLPSQFIPLPPDSGN